MSGILNWKFSLTQGWARSQVLTAFGLNVSYLEADGDRMIYQTENISKKVWDFLGGYGATFFGHNNPDMVSAAVEFLQKKGVVHGQASKRSISDQLCLLISKRIKDSTGENYEIILSSTGSEAVEVAAKHAKITYVNRKNQASRKCVELFQTDKNKWDPDSKGLLLKLNLWDDLQTLEKIYAHDRAVLEQPPRFVAVSGSFHGMTSQALSLTYNSENRFGKTDFDEDVYFIENKSGSLQEVFQQHTTPRLLYGTTKANSLFAYKTGPQYWGLLWNLFNYFLSLRNFLPLLHCGSIRFSRHIFLHFIQ